MVSETVIMDTPFNLSLLAELGHPETRQPRVSYLIREVYSNMFAPMVDKELEREEVKTETRISKLEPEDGFWEGEVIAKKQRVVVADIMRAGMVPSELVYTRLCSLLDPGCVHQDHLMSQRDDNPTGVTKSTLLGSKIGGSVQDQLVIIPDPMGATGNSMAEVMSHYLEHYGTPKRFVTMHLVIVRDFIERLMKIPADIHVYAARQDPRLTTNSYIVPGLGGVGEMISGTDH